MNATNHKDALKDQIRWLFFLFCPGVKCASFLSPLLGILITSVWLQQPGFSQLFRATQKPLIGIHSALRADSSIAPTLTTTASRGHSFWRYCAREPAPIQSQHKSKYTGLPRWCQHTQILLFEFPLDRYLAFPCCGCFSRRLWHWSVHRLVSPTGCLLCCVVQKHICKEHRFSHSLHW